MTIELPKKWARLRSTSATERRVDNFKLLLKAMEETPLMSDQISALLKFSPSGTRKYVREMREAGAIEIKCFVEGTATYVGRPLYQLGEPARVAQFLVDIQSQNGVGKPGPKAAIATSAQHLADKSRHFHVMADDVHYAIKVTRIGPVVRDPLVAALFGPAVGV